MGYFTTFLSQIGIEESEQFLAQIGEVIPEDALGLMAMSPEIYMGLAQIANDYHKDRNDAVQSVLAQVGSSSDDGVTELAQMMATMDTSEIKELNEMLLAQTNNSEDDQ